MTHLDASMLVSYQKENGGFPMERVEFLLAFIATLLRVKMGSKTARLTDLLPSSQTTFSDLEEFFE